MKVRTLQTIVIITVLMAKTAIEIYKEREIKRKLKQEHVVVINHLHRNK